MSQQAAEAPMNWFRQGLFAPVTEEVTAFDLPVTGRIPSELNVVWNCWTGALAHLGVARANALQGRTF
jgi:hypothetical protein